MDEWNFLSVLVASSLGDKGVLQESFMTELKIHMLGPEVREAGGAGRER